MYERLHANRKSLYAKKRIGLSLAIEKGSLEILEEKGDYEFFADLFDK